MAIFDSCLLELNDQAVLTQMLSGKQKNFLIPDNARTLVVSSYITLVGRKPTLIVTRTEEEARQFADDLSKILHGFDIMLFPSWETLPFERISPSIETMGKRNSVLSTLRNATSSSIIVGTARAVSQILTPSSSIGSIELTQRQEINYENLLQSLIHYGYQRTSQVERRGEFAVRGSIIDIFPSTSNTPIRIDTWGDEIER